jgi:predicted HTH transcriptional regulator
MYLAGYIERLGTGTRDTIRLCNEKELKEPDFIQEDVFKTIIWRTGQATGQVGGEATGEVTGEVQRVVIVMNGEMKRAEIQHALQLKHDDFFRIQYIIPALESGVIEMTYPDTPKHPKQRYRLTTKGLKIKKQLEEK